MNCGVFSSSITTMVNVSTAVSMFGFIFQLFCLEEKNGQVYVSASDTFLSAWGATFGRLGAVHIWHVETEE